jgi:hypothetical protein
MEFTIDNQNLINQAMPMFLKANVYAKLHEVWAKLTHRCFCLLNLDDTIKRASIKSSHYAGVKDVDIHRIRGTQGKANEFDAEFNPIQWRSSDRWLSIATEKMRGREMPPVELIQIGDIYYVRDGHHRISVSRSMGQAFIDAEITVMQLEHHN